MILVFNIFLVTHGKINITLMSMFLSFSKVTVYILIYIRLFHITVTNHSCCKYPTSS